MRAYLCPRCRALMFFDSTVCLTCGTELAFDPTMAELRPLDEVTPCSLRETITCNWISTGGSVGYCRGCELTRVRPSDCDGPAMVAWIETEAAKRMLIAQLDVLGLPVVGYAERPGGLAFDLLSSAAETVTTGHADGVITLDLAEGDDAHREAVRISLQEPYRTVLGHLRHEIGHYYWPSLTDDDSCFRELFGDESVDYSSALAEHYGSTDAGDREWAATHVSHYAAAHPWEDWAETFAHYLHIRDVLDTADAWRLHVDGPDLPLRTAADAPVSADPTDVVTDDFDDLINTWLPLSFTLNALNRSMGHPEGLYPFLLPPPVLAKLRHVHERVAVGRDQA